MRSRFQTPEFRIATLVVLALAAATAAAAQDGLLPTAQVVYPVLSQDRATVVAPTVTFAYAGTDPDTPAGAPLRVRFFFTEAVTPDGIEIRTRADYELHVDGLVSFADSAWSPWMDYPAAEEQRRITFPALAADRFYLFALQTLDADGAASLGRGYQQEVAHIEVRAGAFQPYVTLSEIYLGTSAQTYLTYELAAGQPLNFSWTATADAYGGTIVSYRYGWDLVDPNDPNDPGWAVPPGLYDHAPERAFQDGIHTFLLRVVDDSGQVTQLERQLRVIPYIDYNLQFPLLVIDQVVDANVQNWPDQSGIPRNDEDYRNAYWHFLAEGAGGVAGFDWERDRFDHRDLVSYADLVPYRAVLCYAQVNTSQLMFNEFRPVNRRDRYVWLAPYQHRGGNFFLVGGGSMDSFLETLPNYMTPLIFDVRQEYEVWNGTTFVVGFGTKVLPDGSEVDRGPTMYPYATAGISAIDWTSLPSKYIYARPIAPMRFDRHVDCAGLKALVLDPAFRDHWAVAPGAIADTIATEAVIDWQDAVYDAQGTLDVIHNTFPFRDDEFVNANISARTNPIIEQQCDDPDAPGGLCIEPMFRGIARFDWLRERKWEQGQLEWPQDSYTDTELDGLCGVMALSAYGQLARGSARTNGRTFGYVSYKMTADKPSGVPDVYWGFDPYRFDNAESKKAIRWVLDMFGLQINP